MLAPAGVSTSILHTLTNMLNPAQKTFRDNSNSPGCGIWLDHYTIESCNTALQHWRMRTRLAIVEEGEQERWRDDGEESAQGAWALGEVDLEDALVRKLPHEASRAAAHQVPQVHLISYLLSGPFPQ